MAAAIEKPEIMRQEFVDGSTVTLKDSKCRYAHLMTPDTEYGSEWSIQIALTKVQADAMRKVGFTIQVDADGDNWIKCKRYTKTKKGVELDPPRVIMEDGSPVTQELGNGSEIAAITVWSKYTPPIKGKIYLTAYIDTVVVRNIVPREIKEGVTF